MFLRQTKKGKKLLKHEIRDLVRFSDETKLLSEKDTINLEL